MLIEIRHTSLRRNMYFLLMGTLMSRSTLVNDVNIIHIEHSHGTTQRMLSFSHVSLCIFSQLQICRVLYFIKTHITLYHFAVERICRAIHEKMTTFYGFSVGCFPTENPRSSRRKFSSRPVKIHNET